MATNNPIGMEKAPTLEMDLEGWELLSNGGGNPKGEYFDPPGILLESIEDIGKGFESFDQDEKVIREIMSEVPPPPLSGGGTVNSPTNSNDTTKDTSELKREEEVGDQKAKAGEVGEEEFLCSGFARKAGLDGIGFSVCGLRFSGIGALCTIGVAAATICLVVLGGCNRQKPQNQNIQFQICTEDKNLKQMVKQSTRLNHVISATGANISFGGHFPADI